MKPFHSPVMGTRILFCFLVIIGCSSSASMGESSYSSPSASHFRELVASRDQLAGGKRAYNYRSEYKRLPTYQFGLGKRWAPGVETKRTRPFSFGLGKRTNSQYGFGLGKRNGYDDAEAPFYAYPNLQSDLYDSYLENEGLENYLQRKRTSGGFSFGLGKREAHNGDGLYPDEVVEKVPVKHLRDKFKFGIGKRFYEEDNENDA